MGTDVNAQCSLFCVETCITAEWHVPRKQNLICFYLLNHELSDSSTGFSPDLKTAFSALKSQYFQFFCRYFNNPHHIVFINEPQNNPRLKFI
jgi:hypothetical protein